MLTVELLGRQKVTSIEVSKERGIKESSSLPAPGGGPVAKCCDMNYKDRALQEAQGPAWFFIAWRKRLQRFRRMNDPLIPVGPGWGSGSCSSCSSECGCVLVLLQCVHHPWPYSSCELLLRNYLLCKSITVFLVWQVFPVPTGPFIPLQRMEHAYQGHLHLPGATFLGGGVSARIAILGALLSWAPSLQSGYCCI